VSGHGVAPGSGGDSHLGEDTLDTLLPPIPDSLRENLAYNLGGASVAEAWLAEAAACASALVEAWRLRPLEVLSGGSFSLCVKCAGPDGELLVLKVPASRADGAAEIAALRAWDGDGAARVLREDPASSAMLMDYLGRVGDGDYGLDDIVDLAERLHRGDPEGNPFMEVHDNLTRRIEWARERFLEEGYERHQADLELAEKLVVELQSSDEDPVLLHGDLQAKNLIVHGEVLTAVDPMPVLGPAMFDVAFWIAKSHHAHPTHTYVDKVAALRPGIDVDRLLRWTWALAVLENRPYAGPSAGQRQEFIDGLRERATA
jgi:streptomycin 6-kinase